MERNRVEEQYNSMSYFYNVLYSGCDMKVYEDEFINQYKELLNIVPRNAKVLDYSCGNGIQVAALKRNGFNVIGTDISSEMMRNIKFLYKVTKTGGKIIIDTRNWDKVLKKNVQ